MTLVSSIKEVYEKNTSHNQNLTLAVVKAADDHVLECIKDTIHRGDTFVYLIDDQAKLQSLLEKYDLPAESYQIIDQADDDQASQAAVKLAKENKISAIMKGKLSTGRLLKPVVNKENGIRKSQLLTHVAVLYVPKLDRLIGITDGGMALEPDFEDSKIIIQHGIEVFQSLGIQNPKVTLLSASEEPISKLASSNIQVQLTEYYANRPEIVEGPLSTDISLVPDIAKEKNYAGQIQGDADIVMVPNIVTGNSFSKALILFGGAMMAGIIMGAEVPIILTSRSASAEEKYASILLAQTIMNASK